MQWLWRCGFRAREVHDETWRRRYSPWFFCRETPPDTYPRGSEPLQLPDRRHDSTVVGVHNAWVITDKCRNRNRFGRRKGEIEEHASIRHLMHFPGVSSYRPGRFEPLRQSFGRGADRGCRKDEGTRRAEPFPRGGETPRLCLTTVREWISFAVIIACTQVLFKVLLGIGEAVLRLGRQHARGSITCHRETCSHLGTTFSAGCALLQRMETIDARPLTRVRRLCTTGMTITCTNE